MIIVLHILPIVIEVTWVVFSIYVVRMVVKT